MRTSAPPSRSSRSPNPGKRAFKTDWKTIDIATPAFTGLKVIDDLPLKEIREYIDWSPFFHAWEIRGRYPALLDDPELGPRCRELFDDAQKLLDRLINKPLIHGKAVYGFFPAASGARSGSRRCPQRRMSSSESQPTAAEPAAATSPDDIILYTDESPAPKSSPSSTPPAPADGQARRTSTPLRALRFHRAPRLGA